MGYTQPFFNVRKFSGYYSIFPDGVTTDDLYIFANPVDVKPVIILQGDGNIRLDTKGGYVALYYNGTNGGDIFVSASGMQIDPVINTDLFLAPTGTGKVMFGTFTSDATVTQSGYITIKDSGGTTRYLSCITP